MATYRRKKDRDTWHWCKNCPDWPTSDYVEVTLPGKQRPSYGELDNKCKSREDKGTCDM